MPVHMSIYLSIYANENRAKIMSLCAEQDSPTGNTLFKKEHNHMYA